MRRRRLRLVASSDEEDDASNLPSPPPPLPQQHVIRDEDMDDLIFDDIETDFQTVTLNSGNPVLSSNNSTATAASTTRRQGLEPILLDISDDEPENITIGDSTDNSFSGIASGNNSPFQVSESPVHGVLERLGLRLRREWLDSCLQGLQASVQGFQRMDDSAKAKLCFQQFLFSDINYCGAGVLPPNVHTLHLVDLKGPFVLQVDEIVNISSHLRGRYQNAAPGIKRCLKLSMTDGIQRVFGMEYRPIKDLQVLGPAGLKVAVCNVNIRHGLLMLVPEVVEVLGGSVDELEAARQRLVEEVNKPPRGRRTRTGDVPPLTTRATLAAWPPSSDAVPGNADRNHPANSVPLQSSRPGSIPASDRRRRVFVTPISSNNTRLNTSHAPAPCGPNEIPGHIDIPIITPLEQVPGNVDRNHPANSVPLESRRPGSAGSIPASGMRRQGFATPISSNNARLNTSHTPWPCEQNEIQGHIDTPTITPSEQGHDRPRQYFEAMNICNAESNLGNRSSVEPIAMSAMQPLESVPTAQHTNEPLTGVTTITTPLGGNRQGIPAISVNGDSAEPTTSPVYMDAEEIFMDDLENRFMLSRDQEIPFTYLASLSAKCVANVDETSVVRGKIKCVITAVTGFQYAQRTTYELRVYVDDGSLISEISISHNVVRNAIGYSPQDVTSALQSSESERACEMKKTLKQFQIFLVNFEGTIIVEMKKASPMAVAVEMDQGCPAPDAWLLLKRVKSFSSQ